MVNLRKFVRFLLLALSLTIYFGSSAASTQTPSSQVVTSPKPPSNPGSSSATARGEVINKYCITCHSDRLHTAGLTLSGIDAENIGRNAEVWEKILLKLRTGQMPPA